MDETPNNYNKGRIIFPTFKRKGNAEYHSRQIWKELNLPASCSSVCKPNIFTLPEHLLKHNKKMKPTPLIKPKSSTSSSIASSNRKKRQKSYTAMRQEREEFRKKLVELIASKEDDSDDEFPSSGEKEILRYYYYIKHGIDTIHVSPMDAKVLKRVVGLIPKKLMKWKIEFDLNVEEIKAEYLTAVKKAIVDFVLGDSLHKNVKKEEVTDVRLEAKSMALKWKHRYESNKIQIKQNLFSINSCLAQILSIWHTMFENICLIDVEKLSQKSGAYDLSDFTSILNRQIEDTKTMLNESWYGQIQVIFSRGTKRKIIPSTKPKLLKKFFDSVSVLMTHQLQDLCIRSLYGLTDFLCDIGVSFVIFFLNNF